MRISDWSSDVCSSDLLCLLCGARRQLCRGSGAEGSVRPQADRAQHRDAALLVDHLWFRGAADAAGQGEGRADLACGHRAVRSEEHTSELQSLMRISYAVFCLKKKTTQH